jgi:hypothetical protein
MRLTTKIISKMSLITLALILVGNIESKAAGRDRPKFVSTEEVTKLNRAFNQAQMATREDFTAFKEREIDSITYSKDQFICKGYFLKNRNAGASPKGWEVQITGRVLDYKSPSEELLFSNIRQIFYQGFAVNFYSDLSNKAVGLYDFTEDHLSNSFLARRISDSQIGDGIQDALILFRANRRTNEIFGKLILKSEYDYKIKIYGELVRSGMLNSLVSEFSLDNVYENGLLNCR